MASVSADCEISDGPVLTLINKRIRNLRKKLNRISQLEESVAQRISVIKNKEQEELLKSKPSIVAAVDELEKLRQPLSVAVDDEIDLAIKHRRVEASANDDKKVDGDEVSKTVANDGNEAVPSVEEDLLKLIYFGSMFDVKSQSDFNSIMLTRTHERNCCLTYDYVTDDDAAVMLGESDLDLISMMSSLLVSRPVNSSFSHQNALQRCVEHAKLWLAKSEQPIDSNSSITYAALREKLAKIIGSDFYKITPEMKATAVVAAEAAGNYSFHVPVVESTATSQEDHATDFQINETQEDQSGPAADSSKHEAEVENSIETQVHMEQVETPSAGTEYKEQYAPRITYNQRDNGRSGGGSGRGGGRGYGNGRGGRSGGRGGPYQNGRNQYNEQPGNYYQRNYYGGRGRGGSNGYNRNGSGGEVVES